MKNSKTPTLFIYADKPLLFHKQETVDRLEKMPGSQTIRLQNTPGEPAIGHWFMYTAPERLNSEMSK